jgi:palmitoyltransferase ZDHHC9/14/18
MTTILSELHSTAYALNQSDPFSPFSQKNIQECRCGTESCRGVLGPKPKKPIEEKSVASALISGTKRKLQDLLGPGRAKSESSQSSPKKRKMLSGEPITVKNRNTSLKSGSARDGAERDATELSRQIASREDRALKRSTSQTAGKPARSTKAQAAKTSAVRVTRHTTVNFQRRVPRPGAMKMVKMSSSIHSDLRRSKPTLNKKGLRSCQRPRTPMREADTAVSDSEESASPNITPASLRSASRKLNHISPSLQSFSEKGGSNNIQSALGKANAEMAETYPSVPSRSRSVRGR